MGELQTCFKVDGKEPRKRERWERLETLLRGDYRMKCLTRFERMESGVQMKGSDPGGRTCSSFYCDRAGAGISMLDIRKGKQFSSDGFSFHCEVRSEAFF